MNYIGIELTSSQCGGVILKTEILKCTGFMIGLLFVFSLFPQSAATVVWSDDFSDGNYDGWTVTEGTWVVTGTEMYLECDHEVFDNRISHPSTQIVGTWSFDHYQGTNSIIGMAGTYFFFMQNGTDPTYNYDGYGIKIAGTHAYLVRSEGSIFTVQNLGLVDLGDIRWAWVHYDVTRNSTGGFNVYVNVTDGVTEAEPDISVVDTTFSLSQQLVVHNNIIGSRVDNVEVDDEILITPPVEEPTTTEPTETPTETPTNGGGTPLPIDPMLLLVGGGVVVVIIAVVVLMKRR